MGAWGPAVFSDDVATDIRDEYRAMLEDQVPDDEATSRIIDAYRGLDEDEEHVLWLALAATQARLGRLDETVKARALEVIDTGRGLQSWQEAGPKDLAQRRAALAKLRGQLTGPQPARKTLRRPWRHVTDLQAGDLLSYRANGAMMLLRVARVDDHRLGAAPILAWLDWAEPSLPDETTLTHLPTRPGHPPLLGGPPRPATFHVDRWRKKDPDWRDVGFELVAHIPPRPEDAAQVGWVGLGWEDLAEDLQHPSTTYRT